jgi:hypothetical protein
MSSTTCAHCGADTNPAATGGYCVACGKTDADARSAGELTSGRLGTEAGGAIRQAKRIAAQGLFGVAALYFMVSVGFALLTMTGWTQAGHEDNGAAIPPTFAIPAAVVLVFGGLGWWATSKPLLASLTGLVLYAALTLGQFLAGQATSGGLVLMFMILAVLVYAVIVSAKAGRLAA